jgi:FkbH-like protein
MPEAPEQWFDVIAVTGELDRLPPTEEDRTRAGSYEHESRRRQIQQAMSTDEFLSSLALRVKMEEPGHMDLARFAQLVAKTNQFTLDGHRRSEAELAACISDLRYAARIVSASDRFGDYGVVGAFLVDREAVDEGLVPEAAVLDTFVLSCRALARGIEGAMLVCAFDLAGGALWANVRLGKRNGPAVAFFGSFGAQPGVLCPLRRPEWPVWIRTDDATMPVQVRANQR